LKKVLEVYQVLYTNSTNWTVIRPAGLKTSPATGKAILTEDNKAIRVIHREDMTALVIKALRSANTERKVLSALDTSLDRTSSGGICDYLKPKTRTKYAMDYLARYVI
jgi:hypothetical protein